MLSEILAGLSTGANADVPAQIHGKRSLEWSTLGLTESDECIRPYRQLALCVVERALLDLRNPGGSAEDRESAEVFLRGSSMLFHWCEVAALDPSRIVTYAERLAAVLGRADGHCSSRGAMRHPVAGCLFDH